VIGDTSSGSGDTKRTHVLVKPFAAGLATNVVITTDRRTYHLALTSTARTAMSALSWVYPQDQLIALRAAAEQAEAARPIASGLQIEQLHFDYMISGDQPAWRPLRAFDDGRQTFIEFPASLSVGEAPPLFLVDANGAASLVNYRVQGRYYVVDRIFDTAELRLGLKHQDIVRITRTGEIHQRRRAS
jgi:type IV secretion system protein VirB9